MKHTIRWLSFILSALLLLILCVPFTLGASASEAQSQKSVRSQELLSLLHSYETKEPFAAGTAARDVVLSYFNKLQTETDADDVGWQIDAIYYQGVCAGTLAWIYHSHPEVHPRIGEDADTHPIFSLYNVELGKISARTVEEYSDAELSAFFLGDASSTPRVNDCYTNLLNAIYAQKITALHRATDSEASLAILSLAARRLIAPNDLSEEERNDPNNPTPTFVSEDAANYRQYLAYVQSKLTQQRNRDAVRDQVEAVFRVLDPSIEFETLEDLSDTYPCIAQLLASLPSQTSTLQMNNLLADTLEALLTQSAADQGEYTKAYLGITLMRKITTTIAGATIESKIADVATSCFGNLYQLDRGKAQAKDKLCATAAIIENLSPDQQTRLESILKEYLGESPSSVGRFDACTALEELHTEESFANSRLSWFVLYIQALRAIDAEYGAYLTEEEKQGFVEQADEQYRHTDPLLREGACDGENDALAAGQAALQLLLRDAEVTAFLHRHPIVSALPTEPTKENKSELCLALRDASMLSDASQSKLEESSLLSALAEAYQHALSDEITHALTSLGASDTIGATAAHTLKDKLFSLDATEEGRPALTAFLEACDLLLQKAEQIKRMLSHYHTLLTQNPKHYTDRMQSLCQSTADAIIQATDATEQDQANVAIAKLDRLMVLERVKAAVVGHEGVAGVSELMQSAEASLLPDAQEPPTDLSAYEADLLAKIEEYLFADALLKKKEQAQDSLANAADALKQTLEICHFLNAVDRARWSEEIATKLAQSRAAIEAAPTPESVAALLDEALAVFRSIEAEATRQDLLDCIASLKSQLDQYLKQTDRYSSEHALKLQSTVSQAMSELEKSDNVSISVTIYEEALQKIRSIPDLLAEAKSDGMAHLQEVYNALLEKADCYSNVALQKLETLYNQAKSEITRSDLYASIDEIPALNAMIAKAVSALRSVPLSRIEAETNSKLQSSILSADNIPSDAALRVAEQTEDLSAIAKIIRQAAKNGKIGLPFGKALDPAVLKLLKSCVVTSALSFDFANATPSSNQSYTVSVQLPQASALTELLGVVFVAEDGSVEFYEASANESSICFSTTHFSDYYIVSAKVVNLIGPMIFLGILLLCEIAVLISFYWRRAKKRKAMPSACAFAPLLTVRFQPAFGLTGMLILGLAVIGLGAWIVALTLAEKRRLKKENESEKTPDEAATPAQIKEKDPIPALANAEADPLMIGTSPTEEPKALGEGNKNANQQEAKEASAFEPTEVITSLFEPLAEITAEDAELLMSDEAAAQQTKTESDQIDREIYHGSRRAQINLDTISQNFSEGDIVTLNELKRKKLLHKNVGAVKILARGRLDKPLTVLAQDFSLSAIKMILLTGGTPIRTHASEERQQAQK